MPLDTILLATDLTHGADDLVRVAADYAGAFSAKVFVVHVSPPHPGFVGYPKPATPGAGGEDIPVGWEYDRKVLADRIRADHKAVQEIAGRLSASGVDAEALLVEGAFMDKLLAEVSRLDIGLVIIGSHEPGALKDLLFGNVAKDVVGRLPCPVLVVPPMAKSTN